MDTMRAARLHVPSRTLTVEDVPKPAPGPGQVRVKVEAAGVCLSDVHLIDGTLSPLYLEGETVTLGRLGRVRPGHRDHAGPPPRRHPLRPGVDHPGRGVDALGGDHRHR